MIDVLRLLGRLLEPLILLTILVLAGVVAILFQRLRAALLLQLVTLAVLIVFGILPGGAWLTLPLEHRFAANPALPPRVDGIIVLGGTERIAQSALSHAPMFSDEAPILALLALGHRYPEAKLVFSGGMHPRNAPAPTEADIVRQFFQTIGVADSRVIYEARSRNTEENAVFSRDLVHPAATETWILVTEAISMPRAVATFRHAGWHVIPYPAGYLANTDRGLSATLDLFGELRLASLALHEWGGLIAYRLMGYTDELFPK